MESRKHNFTIIVAILAFFVGALAFYGVLKLFPTVFLKEITKLEKKVNITDNGIDITLYDRQNIYNNQNLSLIS